MNNSKLFKDAHKMTKLTIQPNETYRYKFGQWLIFLKTRITNVLGFTDINQSVAYIPILKHDREYHNRIISTSYSVELPLTLVKTNKGTVVNSKQYWYGDKYITNWLTFLYAILPIKLLLVIASIIVIYVNIYL